jgi:hypothetical protein
MFWAVGKASINKGRNTTKNYQRKFTVAVAVLFLACIQEESLSNPELKTVCTKF